MSGGKSDNFKKPENIARKEAEEGIELPSDCEVLFNNHRVRVDTISREFLHYLSRTFLSVKPIVCFIYNGNLRENDKYLKPFNIGNIFARFNPGKT